MDTRQPLLPNHLLVLSGKKFRLQDKPLKGGSLLVYSARLEDDITRDTYMIKEFYPVEFERIAICERLDNGKQDVKK